MKIAALAVVVLSGSLWVPAPASSSEASISLHISTPKVAFQMGEPIVLDVSMINNSSDTLAFEMTNGEHLADEDYAINIFDREGRKVLKIVPPALSNGTQFVKLLPSKTIHEDAVLSEKYAIKSPGSYRIQV